MAGYRCPAHKPRPDLGDYTIQTCDRARPTTYVRCPARLAPLGNQPQARRDGRHGHEGTTSYGRSFGLAITPEDGVIQRKAVYSFESKLAT